MDALTAKATAAFEEHLLVCDECRAAVDAAEQYVNAMQNAARQLRGRQ